MIIYSDEAERKAVLTVAELMCAAARTAPKTKGRDNIITKILTKDDIAAVADKMSEIGKIENHMFLVRDAENIRNCGAVVLIGVKRSIYDLNCGYCGYMDCRECSKGTGTCIFASVDLGIAAGSAAACAADNRVDNRIMYSIGRAVLVMPEYNSGEDALWIGIPLSVTGKNPFFDRK